MKKCTREVIEKIDLGDKLTDDELMSAIHMYRELVDGLGVLGPKFALAADPIRRKLEELEWFASNRKLEI